MCAYSRLNANTPQSCAAKTYLEIEGVTERKQKEVHRWHKVKGKLRDEDSVLRAVTTGI